jgi:hypothetical protein
MKVVALKIAAALYTSDLQGSSPSSVSIISTSIAPLFIYVFGGCLYENYASSQFSYATLGIIILL